MWHGHIDGANKRTQADGLQGWTHVEFLCPLTTLNRERYKTQYIYISIYIYYFSYRIIGRKCSSLDWVQGKCLRVDVSIERSHVIHMTLQDCIVFIKIKHTSEHKSNTLRRDLLSHLWTHKYGLLPTEGID